MKTLKEKSARYWLAHEKLPRYIFNNTELFLEKICSGSDNDVYRFINLLWERARQKASEPLSTYMPQVIRKEKQRAKALIISMPTPEAGLEAYYAGVVYNDAKEVRYFVLESSGREHQEVAACICEWTKDRKHLNYGFTKDIKIENFTKFILDEFTDEEYMLAAISTF